METIAGPLEEVDVRAAKKIFPGIDLEAVKRPVGKVGLLIGIHQAGIFPYVADRDKHIDGNLRLLTSIFGTGSLLDGSHPSIDACQVMQSKESYDRSNCSVQSYSVKGKFSFLT